MQFNNLVFPGQSYNIKNLGYYKKFLVRVPKYEKKSLFSFSSSKGKQNQKSIPCLFFKGQEKADKLIIFFHGNGEHIASQTALILQEQLLPLNVHFIAVEYPGYGVYAGSPNAKEIEQDSLAVFDYFNKKLKVPQNQIIALGRSVGTGPATFLASQRKIGALILISALTSICNVAKNSVGLLSIFLKERFNNLKRIQSVKCPCLFIHGKRDTIIPYQHSIQLYENCGNKNKRYIKLSKSMTHNKFSLRNDIILPIEDFLDNQLIEEFQQAKTLKF